jgi:myo-inositol-1(or 4)-monophosphatase
MGRTAKGTVPEDFVATLCKEAGRHMLDGFGGSLEITHKGEVDLVTEVDVALEQMITEAIQDEFPSHRVIGEEGWREGEAGQAEYAWLVDPLDGTTNYVHGYPMFCVSMALAHRGDVLLGAVHDPLHDEFFYAEKGEGSALNGERITVSSTDHLISSLLSTGFPYQRAAIPDNNVALFNALIAKIQGVRRSGSVALDLAYVAAGRLDGHWELHVKPWDTAAGGLLVKEAGGWITGISGEPWNPFEPHIVASNGRIHGELLGVLARAN